MAWTRWLAIAGVLSCGVPAAAAEPPRVVASIGPLHSLTAAVMEGVGAPKLLVPGGASPHAYALRPSEAAELQEADLVVWAGPALERFLAGSLESLAPGARRIEMLELPGLTLRRPREGGDWEAHDHEHEHEAHEGEAAHDHDHEGHDHEGHEHEAAEHEAHEEGHAHEVGHAQAEELDPHVWLDPGNAARLVEAVAAALAELDSEHAMRYRENAARAVADLERLRTELSAQLDPVRSKPFIVFHDAYGYFERAFGLAAVGSVTVSPEQQPSARRIAELRDKIRSLDAVCLFREPQFAPRLVEALAEGSGARVGVLDPLGADLAPGPDAYPRLLRDLADGLAGCLEPTG